jgi:hypothetical protein
VEVLGLKIDGLWYFSQISQYTSMEGECTEARIFKKSFSNLFISGIPEYIFGNTTDTMWNHWKWFS